MNKNVSRRDFLKQTAAGVAFSAGLSMAAPGETKMKDDKISFQHRGNSWTFGAGGSQRTIIYENGRLILKSFINLLSGHEMIPPDAAPHQYHYFMEKEPTELDSKNRDWILLGSSMRTLKQGETELDITLVRDGLEVTKHSVIYPSSSILREWVTYHNRSDRVITIENPAFLSISARTGDFSATQFHWMTGGENQPGSWDLRTETLTPKSPRTFDSYEPFPFAAGAASAFPGDGINAIILQNDRPVWPADGWQYAPNAAVTIPFDLSIEVQKGDRIAFMVNMNKNIGWDTTAFDPTITYADGETHAASKEFGATQGKNNWWYQYRENGGYVDLVYYPEHQQWRKAKDNTTGTPFIGPNSEHPDSGQDVARVWAAPHAGTVRITGTICNTGNAAATNLGYGFRPGSGSYAPWTALYASDTHDGVFIGWDYFGHWKSSYKVDENGMAEIKLGLAGFQKKLKPGETITTPKAFVGLFHEDIDNAGNECLDWQYRYLWDYTRKDWFPAVRMLGYWYKGTIWGKPGASWLGGSPDWNSTFRKVFRVADLMREVGADVYHRDWGWWDRAGDWNGPDFKTTGKYLRKYGMGQLIYAFLYTVDPASHIGKEHPDWLIGETLDMSKPEVVKCIGDQLDYFVHRWGAFEWRNDSFFTAPRKGDDTPQLLQDAGLREIMQGFLDRHPECAFQAVNGGGNYGGYDYTRFASAFSFSDGAVGILRNYYASLLLPPDKTCDIPDAWNPDHYDKAIWRGLLCCNFDMTGDTWDPAKLEGIRELIDIYHYLFQQGVVGRWVRVYRPRITGDIQTMYLQRLSGDRKKGVIIPKRPAPGPVTIYPKGLIEEEPYIISFQETSGSGKRTGSDLLKNGISISSMAPGELIYLNLPYHPGNKLDREPPSAPGAVRKHRADNMGYPGLEICWEKSSDNNRVSYYEVLRDGKVIDKIAKGTFYFDHSAGADIAAAYEVRAVDGAGNWSEHGLAAGPSAKRARIFDDRPGDGITYTGQWLHHENLQPAYEGTLSISSDPGAMAEIRFTGKTVLLFAKLGASCGIAGIRIDDDPMEKIDTYSADDIWGVCVYQKRLKTRGAHNLQVILLGEHSERSSGDSICIDGIRIESA
jgi:hypothetical protein